MLCVTRSIWNRWWQQVARWGVVEAASQRVHQVEEEEEVLEQEQVVEFNAVVRSSTSSSPPRSSSGLGVVSGGGARDSGAVRSTGDVGVYLPSPGKVHSSNSARSEMMYF